MNNRDTFIIITVKLEYELNHEKEFMLPTGRIYTPVKAVNNGLTGAAVFENLHSPLLQLDGKLHRTNGTMFHAKNYINTINKKGVWSELKCVKDLRIFYAEKLVHEVGGIFIFGENSRIISAADWVKQFLKQEYFLQAAVLDAEYDKWQNTIDVWQFEDSGRPHEHMIKKEFTPGRMIIDTEMNPGHWQYKDGYINMIANQMWLGNAFWSVVGESKKERLLSSNLFYINELNNGVLEVRYRKPFIDETTVDAQMELRKILYE